MKKKDKIWVLLIAMVFLLLGVYSTFFLGNSSKFDSKTKAYRVYSNQVEDDENGIMYFPIYKFNVDGIDYQCETKSGGQRDPEKIKKIVYYDSENPEKCMTQYDKSRNSFWGYFLISVGVCILLIFIFKKPTSQFDENQLQNESIDPELAQKVDKVVDNVQLVYKRIVLGIIIIILLFLIFVDSMLFKQTIKAKDYIDATATYVDTKTDSYSSFVDYIYTFSDKDGNQYEVELSYPVGVSYSETVKIKYNVDNPQDFYEESALLNTSGVVWYIVKIVLIILLTILFFNKKLLSRIGMYLSKGKE